MPRTYSVSVGIPVYNEANNMSKIINSLLKQSLNRRIEKIIIISDGSTDSTAKKIKNINDSRIKFIKGKTRLGKPVRENQIFSLVNADFLIILDGDITFSSGHVLEDLIQPMLDNNKIMLSSGKAIPHSPKSLIQNIFYAGTQIWELARNSVENNQLYLCEGEIRAFRKKLFKEMKFPLKSSEDVFPFLYCMKKEYEFKSVKTALVYYRLPKTFQDYLKQYYRYWQSKNIQESNFSKELVKKYYTIDWKSKIYFALRNLIVNPVWTAAYMVFLLLPKFLFIVNPGERKGVWEISSSTKHN